MSEFSFCSLWWFPFVETKERSNDTTQAMLWKLPTAWVGISCSDHGVRLSENCHLLTLLTFAHFWSPVITFAQTCSIAKIYNLDLLKVAELPNRQNAGWAPCTCAINYIRRAHVRVDQVYRTFQEWVNIPCTRLYILQALGMTLKK
jgi:hypothetical protein